MVQAGLRRQNHVLWNLELFSARLPVKVFKTLHDRQSYILSKFHKIEKFQLVICRLRLSQAILKCFIDLKNSVWFTLGSENETMSYDKNWSLFSFQLSKSFKIIVFLFCRHNWNTAGKVLFMFSKSIEQYIYFFLWGKCRRSNSWSSMAAPQRNFTNVCLIKAHQFQIRQFYKY